MGIELNKKTGINLKKGSTISLIKEDKPFQTLSIGLNWGAIPRTGLLSKIIPGKGVDLDGSVVTLNERGRLVDIISYRKLVSKDRSIVHSGDDLTGDSFGDDGKDNETIKIDLPNVGKSVKTIVFFLNSFKKQDFATIPYSKIRIYDDNETIFATFDLSADDKYAGYVSMVMGKIKRKEDNSWSFHAIGEPVASKDLDETVRLITDKYVD